MNRNKVNKNILVVLGFVLFSITTGCAVHRAKVAPAAHPPGLYRVIQPGVQDVTVVPNLRGEYEMLPLDWILVQVNTKYLTNFEVDVDGETLPMVEEPRRQRELEDNDMGYYTRSLNRDLSTSDRANWNIAVYPPPDKRTDDRLTINIRTITLNPAYTGLEKVSAPLTIPVVSRGEGAPLAD